MPNLSAKVFRTYNASVTLEAELHKDGEEDQVDESDTEMAKLLFYNKANREVAILCNHQRSVPKAFESQLGKLQEKMAEIQAQRDDVQDQLDYLTGKVKAKPKRRVVAKPASMNPGMPAAAAAAAGLPPVPNPGKDDGKGSKRSATADDDEDRPLKLPDEPDKCRTQLVRLDKRLDDFRTKIALKQDTKTIALGTSKINYMDPRITVAWCKFKHVPIEKIFNKSLLQKFPWAMEVPQTWTF